VPVEAGDQELWLGLLEVRATLLLPHEVNRLLQVPGPLGFIEDGHVLDWRLLRVDEAFVAEVMDVLDECSDLAQRCSLACCPAAEALLTDLVAR
jgi:hypothetical protein